MVKKDVDQHTDGERYEQLADRGPRKHRDNKDRSWRSHQWRTVLPSVLHAEELKPVLILMAIN